MTLKDQLKRDESLRLMPYHDSVGKLTIGFGRNLDERGISSAEAEMMLENDISETVAEVSRALPWALELDQARRAVLTNMAFNMGIGGLLGFRKALAAMRRGDWDLAAREMLDSKWATQVGARATRLATQMRTGQWT
jgi:lysozyme